MCFNNAVRSTDYTRGQAIIHGRWFRSRSSPIRTPFLTHRADIVTQCVSRNYSMEELYFPGQGGRPPATLPPTSPPSQTLQPTSAPPAPPSPSSALTSASRPISSQYTSTDRPTGIATDESLSFVAYPMPSEDAPEPAGAAAPAGGPDIVDDAFTGKSHSAALASRTLVRDPILWVSLIILIFVWKNMTIR